MLLTVTTKEPIAPIVIQARYGGALAPWYDRAAMYESKAVVVRIETVGDFAAVEEAVGWRLELEGQVLIICEGEKHPL